MTVDLAKQACDVALAAAREAGGAILAHRGRLDPSKIGFKGARDLVTEADLESERIVLSRLRATFPDHSILAEEEFSHGGDARRGDEVHADPSVRPADASHDLSAIERALDAHPSCWIVDPLDGTTNFAHGHPFFAVSIALYVDRVPTAAVVFAPALDECFVAWRGGGAWLNERRIEVSAAESLGDAIFATGFPYRRHEMADVDNNVAHMNRFLREVRGFRRCGSAAIDLAYVAAGRYGFFFEAQLEPWDVAAGALLVREAGGEVSDYQRGERWLSGRKILASNGKLHDVVLSRLTAPSPPHDPTRS